MLTIKIKTEADFITTAAALTRDARELRFWDHYHQVNKGEYAKNQRDMYMRKVDNTLKQLKMNNTERLASIKHIIQTKEVL